VGACLAYISYATYASFLFNTPLQLAKPQSQCPPEEEEQEAKEVGLKHSASLDNLAPPLQYSTPAGSY